MGGKGSGGNGKLSDKKRTAIINDLKTGHGIDELAVTHKVGRTSVVTIREQIRDDLPAFKRKTAHAMMATAARLVEKVADDVENGEGNIQQKSISLGILLDKAGQLSGDSPKIGTIEHRHTLESPSFSGFLEAQTDTKKADVVEIGGKQEEDTGFENLTEGQKPGKPRVVRAFTDHEGGGGVEKNP